MLGYVLYRVVESAYILAWHLVKSMFCKTLNPSLKDKEDQFSRVEDDVIDQLEVD